MDTADLVVAVLMFWTERKKEIQEVQKIWLNG